MITLFRSDTVCPLEDIKSQMAGHIKQLPAKISSIGDCPTILRYELRCEPLDILAWLHNQKVNTKIYWSGREGHYEVGGIAIADGLKGSGAVNHKEVFEYMEDRLSADNPRLRFYGGLNFDHSYCDESWEEFGTYQFIVPQFELYRSNKLTTFAFNVAVNRINNDNIASILEMLDQIDFTPTTTYRAVPQMIKRMDYPDAAQWKDMFLQARASDAQEKIVLARLSTFDFNVKLRADALLKHLKDRTPGCFHFCYQFSTNSAFVGATPERLFRRDHRSIQTEAIAGTRPRHSDLNVDLALEKELLSSQKDAREHKYVVDAIRTTLTPITESLTADSAPSLKKLKGSQHLVTHFEGTLKEKVYDFHLLESLHPTPAVAGHPTDESMHTIKQLEPFSRGWYAGPVGYVGFNQTEFAVAIRCGQIRGHQLSLYAGAGIVDGSAAEDEWNEIENKISNFIKVFEQSA